MVTANPLRMASLLQGYPVRKPFAPPDAGNLQLWLDGADASTLQTSAGAISNYPDKWIDKATGSSMVFQRYNSNTGSTVPEGTYQDMVERADAAANGLSVVRTRTIGSSSSFAPDLRVRANSSAAKATWNFLHSEESHLFVVFKVHSLTGSVDQSSYARDLTFARTSGGISYAGFSLSDATWSPSSTNVPGVAFRVTGSRIGSSGNRWGFGHVVFRSVFNSYVSLLTSALTSITPGALTLAHVRCMPAASVASDRGTAVVGGQAYANNTYTSSASSADCAATLSWEFNGGLQYGPAVDVAEYLIYRGSMPGTGAALVSAYLKSKWGING